MSEPTRRPATEVKSEGIPADGDATSVASGPTVGTSEPASLIGTRLVGRYAIERVLGNGGMGDVYLAEQVAIRKKVAIKVLHPEMSQMHEVVARFEREALAAAHIEHPNIAAATDFGKLEDGSFFLVLEYIEGKSLRSAISDGPLDLGRSLHVAKQIAAALSRAHSLGIVHRDLKPENVMLVSREGDPDFVKVLDFGIAKVPIGEFLGESMSTGQALTQVGMVYGTPEYMAPEQAIGQAVDARADLYALGVIVFEMVTGTRPYDNDSKVALLGMHLTAPIPSMREQSPSLNVPSGVDDIVGRLMAKSPEARFSDAKELIDALDVEESRYSFGARATTPAPAPPLPRDSATGVSSPTVGAEGLISVDGSMPSLPGQPLRSDPHGAPRSYLSLRIAVGAAVSIVLGLVVLATLMTTRIPRVPLVATPDGGDRSGAKAARMDSTIAMATSKIDRGDFASAIEALTAVEKTEPDRSIVHMLLERAYTGTRNPRDAMHEALLWLSTDSTAASDLKLEEDVRNAALTRDAQDDAFALLESKMGAVGVDILYDIAFGNSGRQYPQAASRAKRSVELDFVRSRASAPLGLLLDFRDAKSCDQKHALLERIRAHGDARMLPILQSLETKHGCGFLNHSDCYSCMRRDTMLGDAISAISARTPSTP